MKTANENDLFEHISLQAKSFNLCGMWYHKPENIRSMKFWFYILNKAFMGIFFYVTPTLTQVIYLIKLMISGEAEIQEIAGILNLILTELMTTVELLDLSYRYSLLQELKKQMRRKEFIHLGIPQKYFIERSITLSKKMFKWLTISAGLDMVAHVIIFPAANHFKFLPVKMDFILFDASDKSYFSLIYIYQILYKPVLLLIFTSLQSLRWSFMICIISQLDVLIYNFENMKKHDKKKTSVEYKSFDNIFKTNVIHHCAIIEFIKTFEAAFGGQYSLLFLINSCIICTTAVQFVSIQNPSNHIMELFWMFAFVFILVLILYIDCNFGSIITEKNSYISTVVYCYPWINLPKNSKKNLIIFIGQNQRTLAINAAKLIPVSIETFTKVMNWTYKGFAVLNQMKK